MTIQPTEYLRDLSTRLRKVPVCHGVDGHDIDCLREVSMGIAELEKANVAYVDANTNLINENKALRQKLFPYADATEISGISWDGKYLIGDKASIKFFHEMKNRGEQIDVYKRAYDQNLAAKDAEIAALKAALEPFNTNWADENGWSETACQKDRVVDWFGPSDFRRVRAVLGEKADV